LDLNPGFAVNLMHKFKKFGPFGDVHLYIQVQLQITIKSDEE
jgi:hypothetical protein